MRKRLLTLMLIGVLGFVPTVTMFSPPNIVYAADESELEKLSKCVTIGGVDDSFVQIKSLDKESIYVVAKVGKNYYQLSRTETSDDDKIACYSFDLDNKLDANSTKKVNSKAENGELTFMSKSDYEKEARGIINNLDTTIDSYLFYNSDGSFIGEFNLDELNSISDVVNNQQTLSFEVKVLDVDTYGANVIIKCDKSGCDDTIDGIKVIDKDGNIVDYVILDSVDEDGNYKCYLTIGEGGTYILSLVTSSGFESSIDFEFNRAKLEKEAKEEIEKLTESFKYDDTKPVVSFDYNKKPIAEGEVLKVKMKTQLETKMKLGVTSSGEYAKVTEFEIKGNGSYPYTATSKSGIRTTGTLKIDCFKPVDKVYKDYASNGDYADSSSESNTKELPKTGFVATALIISILSLCTGFYLLIKGIKRKENINNEED